MSKYRKKPVKVEAVQFDGTNESVECILQQAGCEKITRSCDILFIETPVGTKSVTIGDYIIIDINGELNTYKPDIFHKSFEKIEDDDLLNEKPIFFEDLKNGYTKAYTKSDIDMLIEIVAGEFTPIVPVDQGMVCWHDVAEIIEDNKRLKEELFMERTKNEAEIYSKVAELKRQLDTSNEVIKYLANLIK